MSDEWEKALGLRAAGVEHPRRSDAGQRVCRSRRLEVKKCLRGEVPRAEEEAVRGRWQETWRRSSSGDIPTIVQFALFILY